MRTHQTIKSRLCGALKSRINERLEPLVSPGGPRDQIEALVGLARALADGVADELIQRLPLRMLYAPQPTAAPAWQPPAAPVEQLPSPYLGMTVVALKDAVRKRGLSYPPRVKKAELIRMLEGA